MSMILYDTRQAAGKTTQAHHYMNEAKLINSMVAGVHAGLDRESLSLADLDLIARLETLNATMIGRGLPRAERRNRLTQEVCMAHRPFAGGTAHLEMRP